MIYRTIAIAVGIALVMGAFMNGATKPLNNQAFAAAEPCKITLSFNVADPQTSSFINGNLNCGSQDVGGKTIHLTLHGITTGSTHTTDIQTETGGDFDKAVTLVPGHSYTADATFDGDSNLQPTSATASTTAPGTAPESTNSSS